MSKHGGPAKKRKLSKVQFKRKKELLELIKKESDPKKKYDLQKELGELTFEDFNFDLND